MLGTKKVSKKDNYLKIALAKGRLAEKAIILFKKIGFDFSAHEKDSRKLIFEDKKNKLQFFFVKPVDVPTYVEYGASDIGITGEDIILEEAKDVYEVLDLKYAKCKIVIAGNEKLRGKLNAIHNKRIATKYPHITQEYFSNKYKESVEIIKLSGSVELGPLVSLSEIIVDLVESGGTLKENGLVVLDEIANSSARIIVNRASRMLMKERIDSIVKDLKRVI
ncbi:MAG: ATP phosphoribosyltransferase [Clostridiales Family XIII bacterium]|nr:ATP phosphoribosyltransferase [Clostridiales Family XIII bacterium]